jgi:hypothetical protein
VDINVAAMAADSDERKAFTDRHAGVDTVVALEAAVAVVVRGGVPALECAFELQAPSSSTASKATTATAPERIQ